ncbi:hypothetical protein LTR49_024354 [Elasticomyces elasticus]|nr:hypothetical protein LTR49_024354 [Elasticomyces elasticus]KAK5745413.1 hypothetical protein LTS12_023132 [Elasticomyces elasticus]
MSSPETPSPTERERRMLDEWMEMSTTLRVQMEAGPRTSRERMESPRTPLSQRSSHSNPRAMAVEYTPMSASPRTPVSRMSSPPGPDSGTGEVYVDIPRATWDLYVERSARAPPPRTTSPSRSSTPSTPAYVYDIRARADDYNTASSPRTPRSQMSSPPTPESGPSEVSVEIPRATWDRYVERSSARSPISQVPRPSRPSTPPVYVDTTRSTWDEYVVRRNARTPVLRMSSPSRPGAAPTPDAEPPPPSDAELAGRARQGYLRWLYASPEQLASEQRASEEERSTRDWQDGYAAGQTASYDLLHSRPGSYRSQQMRRGYRTDDPEEIPHSPGEDEDASLGDASPGDAPPGDSQGWLGQMA